MLIKAYPILSRTIQNQQGGNHKLSSYNAVFSIVRSLQHPVNNTGSAEGVSGIGCGSVWVSLDYLQFLLGCSQKKLIQLIYKGADYNFWRGNHIQFTGDGLVKFSLRSPAKIAEFNGFEFSGGCITLEEEDLNLKSFSRRTAEFAAYCYQQLTYNAARFHANRSKSETGKKKKLASPQSIVNCSTSESAGKLQELNNRFVEIDPVELEHYGITQEYLSKKLGCSVHTVKLHLSKKWRESKGLSPLEKKQQCVYQDDITPKEYYRLIKYFDLLEEPLQEKVSKLFCIKGKVYLALNNIYNSEGFICKPDFAQRLARLRLQSGRS